MPIKLMDRRADETAVLVAAREGSAEALGQLYVAHADEIYRVALNLSGSRAEAEDVLQDVFVGLPEALRSFDQRGSLEGWLKRVAVRVTLMRMRRRSSRREVAEIDVAIGSAAEAAVARVMLERALSRLSERLREVFVLKEMHGYSHEETAQLLGISKSAAEVRLFRAKRELRRLLGGND